MTRLQELSYAELRAVAEALAQYVENANDEGETAEERAALNPHLAAAESLLDEVEVEALARTNLLLRLARATRIQR
jgi:hypothetical protein